MRKQLFKILSAVLLSGFVATSCNKFLDVNTNPNASSTTSPDLVLNQAIVYTGSMVNTMNTYGMQVGGYGANAGGYGGFGIVWTYGYSTGDFTGIWSSSYDILEDFQYIINSTVGNSYYDYFNAAAKIMKVYNFERLVDWYNNVPYSEALNASNTTPAYDDAATIYVDLARTLDSAITTINDASGALALTSGTDPLFSGDMTSWIKFANTLKLRLIVRASSIVTFDNTTFTSDGFLTDDAIENPTYSKATGKANPMFSGWVADYTGAAGNRAYIPAMYTYGYYDGNKLTDTARGKAIYFKFPNTPLNQLGVAGTTSNYAPDISGAWYCYSSSNSGSPTKTSLGDNIGVMKGYDMGMVLMTAAESYFLQAEAQMRGIISGDDATSFNSGIEASFHYLYELASGTVATGYDYETDAATYITTNTSSYLVNYSLATTTAQKLEAIITQKYIALNMINSDEGWNEYRRTGYPASGTTAVNNPYGSFASTQSTATRSDHLPTRICYPTTEYALNKYNVPDATTISPFTSLIFWAK
ncbi:MAG: SusD/RagB family nutrient-binding outer membrane lipoprotein [Chitinophagaceae bacterium]